MHVSVYGREFVVSFSSRAEYDETSIEAINKAIEAATGAKGDEYGYGEEPTYCSDGSCELSGRVLATESESAERTLWSDIELHDSDGDVYSVSKNPETFRREMRRFRDDGEMNDLFFPFGGEPHEDRDDASTWGPQSADEIDWTGLDA